MIKLLVDNKKVRELSKKQLQEVTELCPFKAIETSKEGLTINAACKMCKICVNQGLEGVFRFQEVITEKKFVDKTEWQGIAVYIDHTKGKIHPLGLELIGKAKELADKMGFPVYAIFMGYNISKQAEELLHYDIDEIFVYDYEELNDFLIEPYTAVFTNFIEKVKPSVILVGATPLGRSLAPRVAARIKTGLTADCTKLEINENSDLIQIRPAFGGNIMASILTPNHRPQMATVRYKIFATPVWQEEVRGIITKCEIAKEQLQSRIKMVSIIRKETKKTISEAEVVVAVGRGIKTEKDLALAQELAELLNAEIAATRPLIEAGWVDANRQIGLSGRTVKPKLIITLGISGSIQFKAGMDNAELIIAVNSDEHAHIFDVCHYSVKADLYEVIPKLIARIRGEKANVQEV